MIHVRFPLTQKHTHRRSTSWQGSTHLLALVVPYVVIEQLFVTCSIHFHMLRFLRLTCKRSANVLTCRMIPRLFCSFFLSFCLSYFHSKHTLRKFSAMKVNSAMQVLFCSRIRNSSHVHPKRPKTFHSSIDGSRTGARARTIPG